MEANERSKPGRRPFLRLAASAAAALALSLSPLAAPSVSAAEAGLKIGIVGSGRIGSALGTIWLKAGHEVMFSSLDLEHDKALAASLGGKARAGTVKEAAAFGEVVLFAVPYAALPQLGRELADTLKGKVVIDSCNPIVARDGDMAVAARAKGAGLASAEFLAGTRLVRSFNAIGYATLAQAAARPGERFAMPMAGDDAAAIELASRLVREVGYEPVLVGPLAMGRHLIPGTPLAGEQAPERIRQIANTLK